MMNRIFQPDTAQAKAAGFSEGARYMRDKVEHLFAQWATTHPDPVVADELWTFVEKLRTFLLTREDTHA